jgi:hypothetical protein
MQTTMKEDGAPRGVGPALTLMILAPVIAEVLSGATKLSYISALIPEILVWGGGALLIRELVCRWGGGWTSVFLLGLGLAIAEEFLIQQTSIAPLPWLGNTPAYGRVWGVNWVYFLYMLGYESVWVVLIPAQLTELIFPKRRDEQWLRSGQLVIVFLLFVVGSLVAWFSWTQRARPMVFHVPKYAPPLITVILGALASSLLAVMSYVVRTTPAPVAGASRKAPSLWLVALGTVALAFAWYGLIVLVFAPQPSLPLWIPIAGGIAWSGFAFFVVKRWVASAGWGDMHRWSLVSSAILVCMVAGFLGSNTWSRMDVIGKIALNVIAVVLLLLLGKSILSRRAA